jgi:hypothetical protein
LVEIRFCSLTRVSTGCMWTRCGMLPVYAAWHPQSVLWPVLSNTLKSPGGRGSDLNYLSVVVLLAATGGKHVPLRFSLCCAVACTVRGYSRDGVLACGRSVSFLALSGLIASCLGCKLSCQVEGVSQEQHPTWAPCTGACLLVFPVHFLLCCDGSDRFISAWVRDWPVLPLVMLRHQAQARMLMYMYRYVLTTSVKACRVCAGAKRWLIS